jgi:hypothetical protein
MAGANIVGQKPSERRYSLNKADRDALNAEQPGEKAFVIADIVLCVVLRPHEQRKDNHREDWPETLRKLHAFVNESPNIPENDFGRSEHKLEAEALPEVREQTKTVPSIPGKNVLNR